MSSAFWAMGGYAVYVWGSFAAGAAVLLWNAVAPRLKRRAILKELVE